MVPRPEDSECRRASTITTRVMEAVSLLACAEPAASADSAKLVERGEGVTESAKFPSYRTSPCPATHGIGQNRSWSNALRATRSPMPTEAKPSRSSKVFSFKTQHFRTIPSPARSPHTSLMERTIINQLETEREIDDLNLQIKNLRLQNDFAALQMRALRVRCARYESILGMEEGEIAA